MPFYFEHIWFFHSDITEIPSMLKKSCMNNIYTMNEKVTAIKSLLVFYSYSIRRRSQSAASEGWRSAAAASGGRGGVSVEHPGPAVDTESQTREMGGPGCGDVGLHGGCQE